jgi:hypothetical protein
VEVPKPIVKPATKPKRTKKAEPIPENPKQKLISSFQEIKAQPAPDAMPVKQASILLPGMQQESMYFPIKNLSNTQADLSFQGLDNMA